MKRERERERESEDSVFACEKADEVGVGCGKQMNGSFTPPVVWEGALLLTGNILFGWLDMECC